MGYTISIWLYDYAMDEPTYPTYLRRLLPLIDLVGVKVKGFAEAEASVKKSSSAVYQDTLYWKIAL